MTSEKQVTKAAGVVGISTVVTRILGFLRDMVIARAFGASMAADAYYVAFRIPNTLRRLVGEGALTVAFIPVFVEERQRSEQDAWALANTVTTFLSLTLCAMTFLGIVFAPIIVRVIAPGFHEIPEKFQLTVLLSRITFPYIFFVSLGALAMGILNALRHFLSPALAPMMLNLSLIGSIFLLCPRFETPVVGLAIGVLLGGISQFVFQLPALLKRGFRYRISVDFRNPAVQKIGILLLPALFGLAVHQVNVFANTLLASFLPEGSVSYLYYGYRLVEFPLGIFGMAIATAILPTMSSQSARGELRPLANTLAFALRFMLFITLPSMVGLIVLRVPIITHLFQRGEFTAATTDATSQALLYYTLGLFAIAGVRIIVPVFYAMKDTLTPVKCGAASVALNIGCSLLLMRPLQHNGLALATSISSCFQLGLLIWLLRRRLGHIAWREIFRSTGKVFVASAIMGVCCAPFAVKATQYPLVLAAVILLGGVVFLGGVYILRSEELFFLQSLLLKSHASKGEEHEHHSS
jgi:putative peptidoglycan lipid II flippase